MEFLFLLSVVALTAAGGGFYVYFLTTHPLKMSRYLLATCLTLGSASFVGAIGLNGLGRWMGLALGAFGFLCAYLLTTRAVLNREDTRTSPVLSRKPDYPGLGHTAVIYFTHGEPETFDPIGWINQFREFDEHKITFVPLIARPFFLHRLRKAYLRVGKSDHHRTHQRMVQDLERAFRRSGDETTRFYLCFLDDEPRPDAAVVQALNEGASRIIVSEVFLTISNHTAEGKELIEALDVESFGVPLVFTGPLFDSQPLKRMFVERANRSNGKIDKAKVGVLLVGHGQPAEWDDLWPTETAQETSFRQEVLDLFEQDGYRRENLDLAWMEFRQPKPAARIDEMAANGVQRIVYFSAAISADSLHSQYDVPALVARAKSLQGGNSNVVVDNLGAWNDDPLVIEAIKEKIDAVM